MKRILILAAALAAAGPAFAGQPVTLKINPVDSDGVVTLGDLFDGAGAADKTPVAAKPGQSVVLDAGVVQTVARRAGLDWSNAEGIRRIIIRSGAPGGVAAKGNVEVLTYSRSLAAGEQVQPQDLVWAKVAAAPLDAPRDADALIGMTTRRPLASGTAASLRDVVAPQVIKAGDIVTVTYQDAGISVSMTGKAMANATAGETLGIQNTVSKKVVPATAAAPGLALIGPGADQLRAQRRYALR